jgi:hypothetical protein
MTIATVAVGATTTAALALVWAGSSGPSLSQAAAERAAARVAQAPCSAGGKGGTQVDPTRDAVLGPLVLIGGRRWGRVKPDGFSGHGYKVPVTLTEGGRATLSVPAAMRGRVGLVFTLAAQDRAGEGACVALTRPCGSPRAQPGSTRAAQDGQAEWSSTVRGA